MGQRPKTGSVRRTLILLARSPNRPVGNLLKPRNLRFDLCSSFLGYSFWFSFSPV